MSLLIVGERTAAGDLGEVVERDPEVRQARMIAEAARARLVACVSGLEDGIDLAEAQQMLDAFKDARALAGNAEDRVLLHRGLLTRAEADRRAANRCPAGTRPDQRARPATRRERWPGVNPSARSVAIAAACALLGAAGAALAQRSDSRVSLVKPLLARP